MKSCECDSPGYCEVFKKEMGENPPHWKWCQNASESERRHYKAVCIESSKNQNTEYKKSFFITYKAMTDDCIDLLIPKISQMKISGIVGVPRSGMLVSSICATSLNLPLYTLSQGKIVLCNSISEFGGSRMSDHVPNSGKLLVLDDTAFGGFTLEKIKTSLGNDYYYGVLYARSQIIEKVDVFGKELDAPHLLEWNLFNSHHMSRTLLDFDGVLSPNAPHEICIDEERYIEYIKNVEPFYHRIPRVRCKGIVTARLEKYREITEAWLKRYGIDYGFLKMYPTEKEETRNRNHIQEAANFKAKHFAESNARFFVESELPEAVIIRRESGKFVICPEERGR